MAFFLHTHRTDLFDDLFSAPEVKTYKEKQKYGINTGCEIGVYHADRILTEEELEQTLFQCADDRDMLKMSLTLLKNDGIIASLCEKHWWLTAFSMGNFSNPRELSLQASN